MVLLLVGPAGSGKTTIAQRIAQNDGWIHISEDDFWVAMRRASNEPRDDAGQQVVHAKVRQLVDEAAQRNQNAVLEFLVYEDPPRRLVDYQRFLEQRAVPYVT